MNTEQTVIDTRTLLVVVQEIKPTICHLNNDKVNVVKISFLTWFIKFLAKISEYSEQFL